MISSSTGDEGDFPLFPSDVLEEAGRASNGDPVPLITSNSIHSSSVLCERSSPDDSSCFNTSFHAPVYLDDEEAAASLHPDFELRDSSVSAGSLGVWSKRRLEVGEDFGPFEGSHRRQGWEVGATFRSEESICRSPERTFLRKLRVGVCASKRFSLHLYEFPMEIVLGC